MTDREDHPHDTLSTDELGDLAARLTAHADSITNAARRDIANDMLLASGVIHRLASEKTDERPRDLLWLLHREIARVAADCTDHAAGARLLAIIGVDGGWEG